jgi:hypothetical protein
MGGQAGFSHNTRTSSGAADSVIRMLIQIIRLIGYSMFANRKLNYSNRDD